MREIEFRAKEINKGKWVYGYYVYLKRRRGTFGQTITELDRDSHLIVTKAGDSYEIDPKTLGQYTGLKDKNGTKIFEGDIVKGNFPYAKKCVVVWDNKRCGFYLKPISKLGRASYDPYYKLNSAKLETIGNIFDNGESLNEN